LKAIIRWLYKLATISPVEHILRYGVLNSRSEVDSGEYLFQIYIMHSKISTLQNSQIQMQLK